MIFTLSTASSSDRDSLQSFGTTLARPNKRHQLNNMPASVAGPAGHKPILYTSVLAMMQREVEVRAFQIVVQGWYLREGSMYKAGTLWRPESQKCLRSMPGAR